MFTVKYDRERLLSESRHLRRQIGELEGEVQLLSADLQLFSLQNGDLQLEIASRDEAEPDRQKTLLDLLSGKRRAEEQVDRLQRVLVSVMFQKFRFKSFVIAAQALHRSIAGCL